MSYVELHCHSTASDGTLPPREVVRLAKQSNLTALALTDHDTVAGCAISTWSHMPGACGSPDDQGWMPGA